MFCAKCGNAVPDNASFCPSCGSPIQVAPQQQANTYQQPVIQPILQQTVHPLLVGYEQSTYIPKKRKSKAPFIIIGVSIFLVIAIIATIAIIIACQPKDVNESQYSVTEAYLEAIIKKDTKSFSKTVYPALISEYTDNYNMNISAMLADARAELLTSLDTSTIKLDYATVTSFSSWDIDEWDDEYGNDDIAELNNEFKNKRGYVYINKGWDVEGHLSCIIDGNLQITATWYADVIYADEKFYILDLEVEAPN